MKLKLKHIVIAGICISIVIASCSTIKQSSLDRRVTVKPEAAFPIGSKVASNNFTGTVWLNMLVTNDTIYNSNIGAVTFSPGARTKWHYHPGGQILLITRGKGLYQERGKEIQAIQKGDIIKCPPNVEHWHGATTKDTMIHIAIGTNTDKGSVVWLEGVTDQEYNK